MTRTDIIELIRDSLGFNQALNEAIILRHMDRMQERYEKGSGARPLAWFLFDHDATVTTTANNRYVDKPTGFIQFDDNFELSIVDASNVTHPLYRRDQYELIPDSALIGFPNAYAFDGERLHLYPMPDAVYTINIPCYITSTQLSTTQTSKWYEEFSDLVIEETAYSIAKATRDTRFLETSSLPMVQADYLRRVEEMKHVLQSYQFGGRGA